MDAGFHMLVNYNIKKASAVADGKWHHYALVYDSSRLDADIVRFYKDGVPQPSVGGLSRNDKIKTVMSDGEIVSTVDEVIKYGKQ